MEGSSRISARVLSFMTRPKQAVSAFALLATVAVGLLSATPAAAGPISIKVDFNNYLTGSPTTSNSPTQSGWDALNVGNRYDCSCGDQSITLTNGGGATLGYNGYTSDSRDRGTSGYAYPTGYSDLMRDFHLIAVPLEMRNLQIGIYDLTLYSGDAQYSGASDLYISVLSAVAGSELSKTEVILPDLTSSTSNINTVRVTTRIDVTAFGQVLKIYAKVPTSTTNPVSGLELTSVTVPTPATIALLALGLVGIGAARRKQA